MKSTPTPSLMTRAFCVLLLASALAPSQAAANNKLITKATSAFIGCLDRINQPAKSHKAIRAVGLAKYASTDGTTTFMSDGDKVLVAASDRASPNRLCLMMVEGMSRSQMSIVAASMVKKMKMHKSPNNDRRFSKVWGGNFQGQDRLLMIQKKRDNGFYTGPALVMVAVR